MQNHAHVDTVGSLVNLLPGEGEACSRGSGAHAVIDFSRVRDYFLTAGGGKERRQTVVLTKHDAELLRRWTRTCCANSWGSEALHMRVSAKGTASLALLPAVPSAPTHRFRRFAVDEPANVGAARLAAFEALVAPFLAVGRLGKKARAEGRGDAARATSQAERTRRLAVGGVVIFVPDYLDYCDVRGFLRKLSEGEEGLVAFVSEYSSKSQGLEARRAFEQGTAKVLLCTERAHYFRRSVLNGARHVIFCQLPYEPAFYAELAAYTSLGGEGGTVETLFCTLDRMRLERVVGSALAKKWCAAGVEEVDHTFGK